MTHGELQVFNTITGELIHAVTAIDLLVAAGIDDLGDAHTGELATFTDNARELKAIASEAQGIVSDELVRRMDMNGSWTLRQDGYEIKAASPAAGTVAYDVARLRLALAELVTDGIITSAAANAALEVKRPTAPVPYDLLRRTLGLLEDLASDKMNAALWNDVLGDLGALLLAEPEPTYTVRLAGINALLKLPAAGALIEPCRLTVDPPRRVARVKRASR